MALFKDFVTTLPPRNSKYGTRKIIIKKRDFKKAALSCTIESMPIFVKELHALRGYFAPPPPPHILG